MSDSAPRFYTVAEVAEIARVSRMTVYRMVHNGDLPAIRVGGSYRVPKSALDALFAFEAPEAVREKRQA